jgi:hypothetical protein
MKSLKSLKSLVFYPPFRAYAFCAFVGDAFNTPAEQGDGGSVTSVISVTKAAVIDDVESGPARDWDTFGFGA